MSYLLEDMLVAFSDAELYNGPGLDSFWDKMPADPDRCIVLYEYTGLPPVPYESAVHRSVQITCRNTTASMAKADVDAVYTYLVTHLDEAGRIDFNNRFTQTSIRQTPFKIDEDDLGRVTYGFNIGVTTSIDSKEEDDDFYANWR